MKFTKMVEIGGNMTAILEDGTTRRHAIWYGDSTRPKPTKADGAKDGDELYEDDTKKGYTFNENFDEWRPV